MRLVDQWFAFASRTALYIPPDVIKTFFEEDLSLERYQNVAGSMARLFGGVSNYPHGVVTEIFLGLRYKQDN